MLIALALDVLAAWLISRSLVRWWAWLPAALLAGLAVSAAVFVSPAIFGATMPGKALGAAISSAPVNLTMCVMCTAAFVRSRRA